MKIPPFHLMADGKFPMQDGRPVLLSEAEYRACCCGTPNSCTWEMEWDCATNGWVLVAFGKYEGDELVELEANDPAKASITRGPESWIIQYFIRRFPRSDTLIRARYTQWIGPEEECSFPGNPPAPNEAWRAWKCATPRPEEPPLEEGLTQGEYVFVWNCESDEYNAPVLTGFIGARFPAGFFVVHPINPCATIVYGKHFVFNLPQDIPPPPNAPPGPPLDNQYSCCCQWRTEWEWDCEEEEWVEAVSPVIIPAEHDAGETEEICTRTIWGAVVNCLADPFPDPPGPPEPLTEAQIEECCAPAPSECPCTSWPPSEWPCGGLVEQYSIQGSVNRTCVGTSGMESLIISPVNASAATTTCLWSVPSSERISAIFIEYCNGGSQNPHFVTGFSIQLAPNWPGGRSWLVTIGFTLSSGGPGYIYRFVKSTGQTPLGSYIFDPLNSFTIPGDNQSGSVTVS